MGTKDFKEEIMIRRIARSISYPAPGSFFPKEVYESLEVDPISNCFNPDDIREVEILYLEKLIREGKYDISHLKYQYDADPDYFKEM